MDVSRVLLRRDLLHTAAEIGRPIEKCFGAGPVLEIAEQLYAWCLQPMELKPLTFGFVIERTTGKQINPFLTHPGTNPFTGEPTMSNLQLGDSQQVTAKTSRSTPTASRPQTP